MTKVRIKLHPSIQVTHRFCHLCLVVAESKSGKTIQSCPCARHCYGGISVGSEGRDSSCQKPLWTHQINLQTQQTGKMTKQTVQALQKCHNLLSSDVFVICFRWKMGLVCFGRSQSRRMEQVGYIQCVSLQCDSSQSFSKIKMFCLSCMFSGHWSTQGCQTTFTETEFICNCDHLSFFAVLVVQNISFQYLFFCQPLLTNSRI